MLPSFANLPVFQTTDAEKLLLLQEDQTEQDPDVTQANQIITSLHTTNVSGLGGQCFYRVMALAIFKDENMFEYFKILFAEWIELNRELVEQLFRDQTAATYGDNMDLLKQRVEYNGCDLLENMFATETEVHLASIFLDIKIYLWIENSLVSASSNTCSQAIPYKLFYSDCTKSVALVNGSTLWKAKLVWNHRTPLHILLKQNHFYLLNIVEPKDASNGQNAFVCPYQETSGPIQLRTKPKKTFPNAQDPNIQLTEYRRQQAEKYRMKLLIDKERLQKIERQQQIEEDAKLARRLAGL